jgi:hypothetical protein
MRPRPREKRSNGLLWFRYGARQWQVNLSEPDIEKSHQDKFIMMDNLLPC